MRESEGLKVAILGTRGLPARYGGFETFAEELAVRLVARGVEVTVYCEADDYAQAPEYRGARLTYLPALDCGPLTTILFDIRCLWHARKTFDIVYMLGYGAAPFCLIPRLWGRKVWLNVDGIEWARAKWGTLAKLYFNCMEWFSTWVPHRIIADAEGIKKHLESRHRLINSCSVIPYGAPVIEKMPPVSYLNHWDLEPGKYYLVVARLEPENHVQEIIQGYLSSNSKIPLIILGNHKAKTVYTQSLVSFANHRVRFMGSIYDKETLQVLRYHCRAYFHGHSVGGTNPSLLEALGCGNLVIAHDNLFNREVCGDLGYFFQAPEDIPSILHLIESLSPEEENLLRWGAKSRIREKYTWDQISDIYSALIQNEVSLKPASLKSD